MDHNHFYFQNFAAVLYNLVTHWWNLEFFLILVIAQEAED